MNGGSNRDDAPARLITPCDETGDTADINGNDDAAKRANAADVKDRFAWPPDGAPVVDEGRFVAPSASTAAASALQSKTPLWRHTLADMERLWLSPTSASTYAWLVSREFEPDALDVYCNRCGTTIGPGEAMEFGCATCRSARWPWDRCVRLGAYEGLLKQSVRDVKFHRRRRVGDKLGRLLGGALVEAGAASGVCERVAVVPVPTTWRRRVSRGIDHAQVIAAGVARELRCPLVRALVASNHASQRSVTPGRRAANVSGAFRLRRGVDFTGWTVCLIDDVHTTGATLAASTRALQGRAGSRSGRRGRESHAPEAVWIGVVAVTTDHRRRPADGIAPKAADASTSPEEAGKPLG